MLRALSRERYGVRSVSEPGLAVHRRSLVLRREMRELHDHLKRPVPGESSPREQIHPSHIKSTGKRMSVAMPRIINDLGLFESP